MVLIHPFEQRKDVCLISFGDGLVQQREQRFFIRMDTRWKPKRCAREVFDAIAAAMLEGRARKSFHEAGKKFRIPLRLREEPVRYWIGTKRQANSIDNWLDVASHR